MATTSIPEDMVPGTVRLVGLDETPHDDQRKLRTHIELVPKPSSDRNDPLNWSQRRKLWLFAMVFVYTLGIGIPTTLQYSVLGDITADTGIATDDLVQGTGVMFLFLGWGCLFWQPIALTYGRRGVYLLSTLLSVPFMVWTAYSKSAGEWYAHRILLGIVASPIESLPEVSVPDVFFAHERGLYMAIYVFTLFTSNFLAPLIAGWFALAYGWRWTMHFGAMICALAFVILFFGMEETIYFRNSFEGVVAENQAPSENSCTASQEEKNEGKESMHETVQVPSHSTLTQPSRSYLQKLSFFVKATGRPSNKQMFHGMYLPLVILVKFPSVAWAGFIYGINLSWYMVLNGTISPIMSIEPYNWSTGYIGCVYVGPIIGAAFGALWAGQVADKLALRSARRNGGIREPEHRLIPLALSAVLSAVGLITWGVGAANDVHWVGLIIGLGILVFSVVTGGSIALAYNVDCFKDISGDSTTSVIIVRNTMGFAVSYGITPWYTNMGVQNCFITAGILSLACTATFLVMLWKGKALRRFSAPTYWKYSKITSGLHH